MSKVKIVKNRLRSVMSDDRLADVLILASESVSLAEIPYDLICCN
jgi:hypothetical protein